MKQLVAFLKKEFTEVTRSGKLMLLLILFFMFGIMNPALAKLTPWMLQLMADSLAESGIIIGEITVNAMTSWTQFYKNISTALIVFLLLNSSILTAEYQSGTLINVLTRGLSRWKVIAAKTICSMSLWTLCFVLCYGTTYGYNAYFWGNEAIPSVFFSAFCIYLLGLLCIALIICMSTLLKTGTSVLLSVGGIYVAGYVLSLFPKFKKFSPVQLMSAGELLNGKGVPADYYPAIAVALITAAAAIALGIVVFNKREI